MERKTDNARKQGKPQAATLTERALFLERFGKGRFALPLYGTGGTIVLDRDRDRDRADGDRDGDHGKGGARCE